MFLPCAVLLPTALFTFCTKLVSLLLGRWHRSRFVLLGPIIIGRLLFGRGEGERERVKIWAVGLPLPPRGVNESSRVF